MKFVLREALRDRLTDEIYRRKKGSYSAPPLRIGKGRSVQLNRLLNRYLSAEALDRSGIFSRIMVQAMRSLRAAVPFEGGLARALDWALLFMLSVQILDHLYVQPAQGRPEDPGLKG